MKVCRDCAYTKSESEFIKNHTFKDGIDTLCRACNRKKVKQWRKDRPDLRKIQQKKEAHKDKIYNQRKHLKATYGITVEQYNTMFSNQQGCCAICKKHQTNFKRRLNVDHCHTSGKIRQLLCTNCNYLLGRAKDNVDILNESIQYLLKHQ